MRLWKIFAVISTGLVLGLAYSYLYQVSDLFLWWLSMHFCLLLLMLSEILLNCGEPYERHNCIFCDALMQEADLSALLNQHPADALPGT